MRPLRWSKLSHRSNETTRGAVNRDLCRPPSLTQTRAEPKLIRDTREMPRNSSPAAVQIGSNIGTRGRRCR